nr:hypothetical protein Itr_chr10CG12800 [Ipomoea trifida]GLL37517.1 hypothetical protein Itr_chr10CG12810 [Ipomoea trifida]
MRIAGEVVSPPSPQGTGTAVAHTAERRSMVVAAGGSDELVFPRLRRCDDEGGLHAASRCRRVSSSVSPKAHGGAGSRRRPLRSSLPASSKAASGCRNLGRQRRWLVRSVRPSPDLVLPR